MNLILFDAAELDGGGRLVLADRRGRHVCRVLRAAPGDRLRVGMIRGPTGTGEVIAVDRDRAELAVTLTGAPPAPPPVDLVLAVPRPKVLARVVQAAVSLGVGRLDLVNAWRVDKSYLSSHQLEAARLRELALLGCEQGASTWVPEVAVHRLLVPFLHDSLATRVASGVHAVLAHPRADAPIEHVVRPGDTRRVVVAVGPEGGWIDAEIDSFAMLGFAPVTCAEGVLRVEAAVVAVLAQLALLRRQAGS